MAKIAILPEILCNQIAAGEVVERPAAVVKELVENSIDAQSSKITVSLLQGGRKEIRVVDNGSGMHPEDALLALERHATSKIRSAGDLERIETLGFRGEAIPSIAAVSRFELITREPDALSGMHIRIEGGVLKDFREKGCPPGTQVLVRDLFYCLPARRKFLRTPETELAYITDHFLRIALSHPEIHMQLVSEERVQCDFHKSGGLFQRAGQVLGPDISKVLEIVDFLKNEIRLRGFLAPPDIQRTNTQHLFLFVNGRPVWDRLLQRAVLTSYEALIPRGKYPVAVLFLDLPPMLVDVNVHPAKREIRFRNPGEVLGTVREALLESLAALRPKSFAGSGFSGMEVPFAPKRSPASGGAGTLRENQRAFDFRIKTGERTPAPDFFQRSQDESPGEQGFSYEAGGQSVRDLSPGAGEPLPPAAPEPTASEKMAYAHLPVIGQLANAFILLEAPDGLLIIDQHAAHERILFNQLSKRTRDAGQLLTRPVIVDLLPKEAVLLKRLMPGLTDLGFEIEPFGGSSFSVQAIPASLSSSNPEEVLRDFLRYAEEDYPATESAILSGLTKIASCHSAVRAGQKLRPEEIKHLLVLLDSTETPFTCPHGRPLAFKLTYEQIFRLFKRT
ncbi:MAG: DNA mismatch repair endonuclease MutL [Syntrophobacteraceae bacterium]